MNIIYKVETSKSFDFAVLSIKENLGLYNFGVLWEMNFKDKFQEKGLKFDTNFKILEVCNPILAKKVLDEHLEAGYFLPCKIAVYEENNKVIIGMLKPTELIGQMNNDYLTIIANEVESALKSAIDSARI